MAAIYRARSGVPYYNQFDIGRNYPLYGDAAAAAVTFDQSLNLVLSFGPGIALNRIRAANIASEIRVAPLNQNIAYGGFGRIGSSGGGFKYSDADFAVFEVAPKPVFVAPGVTLPDRLAAQRFRSVSGVEAYDRLATLSPAELQQFLREVEVNGWIVKGTPLLDGSTSAYFFPRKGRFYYDPERMTYLDMLHERKHLELFIERGNWKLGKGKSLLFQDEIAAYSHELDLLRKAGGADPKYIQYLERQVEYYRSMLRGEGASPLRPPTMDDPFFKRPGQ